MKVALPIMKNALTSLAKRVMIRLGLTAATSATGAAIQKKICGSSMTTLIISDEEMKDIMKTVKSLEESGLLKKSVSKTIENKSK